MPDSGPKRWLFPLLWLPYALLAGRFWFVCDDAYISFRYARNLSHGLGLRYNLGVDPPVEGYTNFLWVLVCALIDRLGGEPAFWAPLISFVSGSLLLYLFWCILLREHRIAPPLAALATLGLGLFPPFAVWSTGGLASMPFCLALFASYFLLIYREGLRPTLLAGLCGLALVLLRFEGLGWALVVAGCGGFVRWRTGRSLRPVLGYLMLVLVGFSAYFVWRCGYHGHLWPNTVSTKVSFGPDVARID